MWDGTGHDRSGKKHKSVKQAREEDANVRVSMALNKVDLRSTGEHKFAHTHTHTHTHAHAHTHTGILLLLGVGDVGLDEAAVHL
jgi:hypothetical protein